MKKVCFFLLSLLLVLMVNSCNSDSNISDSVSPDIQGIAANPYAINEDEAIVIANEFLKTHVGLRSGQEDNYNITSAEVNVNVRETSTSEDITQQVPIYTVTYRDTQGEPVESVILAGDERIESKVLMYSKESAAASPLLGNNEAADYFNDLIAGYLHYSVNGFLSNVQKESTVLLTRNDPHALLYQAHFNADWPQSGDPYNRYIPYRNGQKALVGCTAIAMCEIMTWHRWPSQGAYKRYTSSTQTTPTAVNVSYELPDYNYVAVANCMNTSCYVHFEVDDWIANILAEAAYKLNTNFGTTVSTAYPSDVPAVYNAMGYLTDSYSSYSLSKLETDIITRVIPVFMAGWKTDSITGGHAFVATGLEYKEYGTGPTYVCIVTGNGWQGYGPTIWWFNELTFSAPTIPDSLIDYPYLFKYDTHVITNIRPNPNNTGSTNSNWRVRSTFPY